MYLYNSDYLEGCHPDILKRLSDTNLCQTPGYGTDEFCTLARKTILGECGKPDADVHFLVGGTQTNATVIASILKPYQGVMCASSGHINVHETGAIEHSGHKVIAIGGSDGKISGALVEKALKSHFEEDSPEHEVQPGMLYISLPTEVGTLYSMEELHNLKEVCTKWRIPLYIDGARLGYGIAASRGDLSLEGIASVADAFYIGGTKQGTLFGEALVICNDSLKKDFRYYIKQNGGLLAKGRLLGIQFQTMFEDGLYYRLSESAIQKARRLQEAFRYKGYEFFVESPTNQLFPILPDSVADRLAGDFKFELWAELSPGRKAWRFCTSWATTDEQIDALIAAL